MRVETLLLLLVCRVDCTNHAQKEGLVLVSLEGETGLAQTKFDAVLVKLEVMAALPLTIGKCEIHCNLRQIVI